MQTRSVNKHARKKRDEVWEKIKSEKGLYRYKSSGTEGKPPKFLESRIESELATAFPAASFQIAVNEGSLQS
jgi:hypothetical protein